jgi:succinate dehydrogenase/fumarate reductase cytochrome b subunit
METPVAEGNRLLQGVRCFAWRVRVELTASGRRSIPLSEMSIRSSAFALLPLYAVIAVLGILVIRFVFLVHALVRMSHALAAVAIALQDMAQTFRTRNPPR